MMRSVTILSAGLVIGLAACREPDLLSPTRLRPQQARYSLSPSCAVTHPALPASNPVGLNVHGLADYQNAANDATWAQLGDLVRKGNIGWVRMDVRWGTMQWDTTYNIRTDPSTWNWRDLDSTMTRAYCAGLNVVGILQETPPWASPVKDASGWKYNAMDLADWARFVKASVDRYPWVRYWSIWNEPNSPAFYMQTADDYAGLVAAAAPGIRDNYDAQGRRYLIAGEVSNAGNAAAFTGRVLTLQGDKVDVVALHSYGDANNDFVRNFRAATGVPGWYWDLWLTEANVTGCNDSDDQYRQASTSCVNVDGARLGPVSSWVYIDDDAQASFLTTTFNNMLGGTVDPFWKKTFYYDSHSEPNQSTGPDSKPNDYGVIGGVVQHALYGKRAYYALGRASGLNPIASVSGPTLVYSTDDPTYSVTISGGHPDPYYYEWHYTCAARTPGPDCDGSETVLTAGWDETSTTLPSHRTAGTATLSVYVRDTELDSPVTTAFAMHDGVKITIRSVSGGTK